MRNNVRKKMRLICLLFAMVLLAGVPAAAKDRKKSKSGGRKCCKKRNGMQNERNHLPVEK